MTSKTDLDLASIPHPKDCHRVPDGAVLPAGTPCWVVHKSGAASWLPDGYRSTSAIHDGGAVHLTPHPIISHPTPDDSPIIITRTYRDKVEAGLLAVRAPGDQEWCVIGRDGYSHWLASEEITEWSPAVVTKSGHGVWDERDKRARVDADGDTWYWGSDFATWECTGGNREYYGSLGALREWCGDDYLIGFADEESDEEQEHPNK